MAMYVSSEMEFDWLKISPVGALLQQFWKELPIESKRKFLFAICEVTGWEAGTRKRNELLPWPMVAQDIRKFFWHVLELDRWEWRLAKKRPKTDDHPTYLRYLDQVKANKAVGAFNDRIKKVIGDVRGEAGGESGG